VSNATRWYCTRERVKAAVGEVGAAKNALIDAKCEAASADVERMLKPRRFIPETATKLFPWPQRYGKSGVLYLDDRDLLSVTTLKSEAQNASPTTISSSDYYLEPVNSPPYKRIEIDTTSSADFQAGDTGQRSISVLGKWGYCDDTKAAGALAEALDSSETGVDVTDASLIDVGDTLLCESEQMFVSERSVLTTGTTMSDTLTADMNDVTVTVASGAAVKQGEVVLLDSEKMLVVSISGNDLTVERAVDGSVLAAHSTGITVYAYRTLTVVRGVNGTTAAAHDTATALVKYAPPADIVELCTAEAIAHLKQDQSGWTGQISGGEGGIAVRMVDLFHLRQRIVEKYGQVTL
jgi:hypothetical protein